jgi:hypothetical protein
MLALGAHRGIVTGAESQQHLEIAEHLTETCVHMYKFTATGLAPEYVTFGPEGSMHIGAGHNLLRPETAESLMLLWRITKKV